MKKLSFFLMAMLFSVMSFAETYTHTFSNGQLSNGTVTLSNIKWTSTITGSTYFGWDANKGIQIGKAKEPAKAYTLSSSAFADKMITNITVNASMASSGAAKLQVSVGGVSYITPTTLTTSAKDYTGAGTSSGDVVISFTNTAAKAFYIKSISITYTEASAGQGMILVDQTDVDFGKVTKTNTITVTGQSLNSAINAELQDGSNFSVEGDLTAEGGVLTVNFTATEAGKYNDVLVLTSGDVTAEVTLSGEVLILEGQGTKETPYTVADVIALGLADKTLAWVEGYIIGALNSNNNNALETTGTSVASNILLADAANETQNYIPVALPNNSESRKALNLVDNPNNLGAKVAVYGTLETYFSKAGVKEVSDYEWVVAPVVNHTITVSANPAEAGTVTGGDEYEEGATATLTATANEGYEFVNWTVGEEVVSTENPYTFAVTADVEVVANFKEAEPEYNIMDITMTNLVVEESGDLLVLTASDDSNTGLNVMLAINEDGSLAADSYMALVQGWNETELPIVEGKITKAYNEELATDVYSGLVVVEYMGGKLGLNLTMYAAPAAPAIDVVVDNATITVETEDDGLGGTYEVITVSANWQESVLVIEGIEKEFEGFIQIKEIFEVDGEEDWYIWMCMNGVVTTVDNVLTVTGEFKNNWTGDVYNVTISGALPVEEPEVITYELNGGELPAPAVPTNEKLWIAFMPYYQEYYDVVRAEQPITSVAVFLSAGMGDDATIFTSEDSDYKWLGDYIIKVTTEQSAALTTLANWKFNAQAFFNANQYTGWPKSADFTEAGKPEAWGAAYQAAHAVVLPTEPVDAPYTLPTPVKDGFTFVGWYDNAEGTGEAYTVIPAGWAGTLYAIWKQGPTTALENIAVEGKAVKAIVNGQLIIIKNGVQYNAQGQVVK